MEAGMMKELLPK